MKLVYESHQYCIYESCIFEVRKTNVGSKGKTNATDRDKECRKRHLKYQKWTAHPKNK